MLLSKMKILLVNKIISLYNLNNIDNNELDKHKNDSIFIEDIDIYALPKFMNNKNYNKKDYA